MFPVARTDLPLQELLLTEAAASGGRTEPFPRWMLCHSGPAPAGWSGPPPTLCQRRSINSALITQPIFPSGVTQPRPTNHRGPRCLIEFPSAVCALLSADQRCRELRLCSPPLSDGTLEKAGTREGLNFNANIQKTYPGFKDANERERKIGGSWKLQKHPPLQAGEDVSLFRTPGN